MIWLSSTDFRWSFYIYIYPTNSQSYIFGYPCISHFFIHFPWRPWLPLQSPVPRPRSRDEEETEDALHEAGEGVVRVGRSREGDLPHADGQNATWGRKKWGRIFGKEWWFRNSIITWWGWLGMSYVVGTESRNRFYTTSGLWYEGYVADVFCSGMLAT